MADTKYGYTTRFNGSDFEDIVTKTTAALKDQGFGVITEIDVKATMKKKLDIDFRNYKILGACNPGFAHKALSEDLFIGLLLPCNVAVFEEDSGAINVSIVKAEEMFKVVEKPDLAPIAAGVDEKLRAVLGSLKEQGGR